MVVLVASALVRVWWGMSTSSSTSTSTSTSTSMSTRITLSLPGPVLPSALGGRAGRPVSLAPAERVLGRRPGVRLARRAYGQTRAALITTTGVKELHPPSVCLGAAGHEIRLQTEEQSRAGCLVRLDVHREGTSRATFYYTFFNGGEVTCSFWQRAGMAAWARLTGASARWSVLQVMNRDPRRARDDMVALLEGMRRGQGRGRGEGKGRGKGEGKEMALSTRKRTEI